VSRAAGLGTAAAVAVERLGVRPGERVACLCNPARSAIAAALAGAARDAGALAERHDFPPMTRPGEEPPAAVADALLGADVAFGTTDYSISHTRARLAATARGLRFASMGAISEEIFRRAVPIDYAVLEGDGAAIAEWLTTASSCRITCARGTDLTLDLRNREGRSDDGDLRASGAFGNLPAGEGYIAPVEDAGGGTIVFDGSLSGYGLLSEPLEARVRAGVLVDAHGAAAGWLLETLDAAGPSGRHVAELGLGTNPAARVGGTMLEDEKVRGTAHVAFGSSTGVGGANQSTVHVDGLLLRPTVEIDGRAIVVDGRLRISEPFE
jgi:leucyl aminopeptidase (aminopeptidase T)